MRLPQWVRATAASALRRRRIRHADEVRTRLLTHYRVRPEFAGAVDLPLLWWPNAPNFGDAMSPWLVQKMTGATVVRADRALPHHVAIGSILRYVRPASVVWGTGSFGEELDQHVVADADYRAVRGPLTRQKILDVGGRCPKVYGDPALLAPLYHRPEVRKTHEIGLVALVGAEVEVRRGRARGADHRPRHRRRRGSPRRHAELPPDRHLVAARPGRRRRLRAAECLARVLDPKGGEFKFHDYSASVHKIRSSVRFDPSARPVTVERLRRAFTFDDRPLQFSYRPLLDACPVLERVPSPEQTA